MSAIRATLALTLALTLSPTPSLADTGGEPGQRKVRRPLLDWEALTDTWFGGRTWLSDHGLEVEVNYTGEVFGVALGGLRTGATYLGNIDLVMTIDWEKLVGWPGATLNLYGLANHGGSPSGYVGDIQAVSNIDAPTTIKLYEAWLQQSFEVIF